MPDGAGRSQLQRNADGAAEAVLDDWCGTPSRWPWPGPPPWVVDIASRLTDMANTAESADLSEELIAMAGRALDKGAAGG
jgi:hypothetical protein